MACFCSLSLRALLTRWAKPLFKYSSNRPHTSSSTATSLWGGEACLPAPSPEPIRFKSERISLSDNSIIELPSPPLPCVPRSRNTGETDQQEIQPMLCSFNITPPLLEQTSKDRQFKGWSKWFSKDGE